MDFTDKPVVAAAAVVVAVQILKSKVAALMAQMAI